MMRLRLFPDAQGEPRIYSHSKTYKKGHTAVWLYWPGNQLHIEWVLLNPRLQFRLTFDDQLSDHNVHLALSLPYLITLYVGLAHCRWPIRLLGLKWKNDVTHWGDCRREIGFSVFDYKLWIFPWVDTDSGGRWITVNLNLMDVLFGRKKYRQRNETVHEAEVAMPEGAYPATVTLYTAEWKRPRWYKVDQIQRAEIEVESGIPFPGKGENSWDMDDDALFSLTCPANSVEEAVAAMVAAVNRKRERYGWDG